MFTDILFITTPINPVLFTWDTLYNHHVNGGTRSSAKEFFGEGPSF
jgi:hypothetical protein